MILHPTTGSERPIRRGLCRLWVRLSRRKPGTPRPRECRPGPNSASSHRRCSGACKYFAHAATEGLDSGADFLLRRACLFLAEIRQSKRSSCSSINTVEGPTTASAAALLKFKFTGNLAPRVGSALPQNDANSALPADLARPKVKEKEALLWSAGT